MASPNRRGQAGAPVSTNMRGSNYTSFTDTSLSAPFGLKLQQTITSSGPVTIPDGITWVYVIISGGGGGGSSSTTTAPRGGGAGGISWGWTLAHNTCIIGAGGIGGSTASRGGYTRYGNVIAGGGGTSTGVLGGGGGGGSAGSTNYWGIEGGSSGGFSGSGAGGGVNAST